MVEKLKREPFRLSVCLVAMLYASMVTADSEQPDDLFSLSIDELLNLTVSIASGEDESILQSPALVSVLTRQQMQNMGLHSVFDALSFLPGVEVQETAIGTYAIGIRGLVEPFSQKTLILLDGVPYWMPSHSSNGLVGIPVSSIDKIEVIRGPGAVIYGTNASAGVINIITRKDNQQQLQLGIGSQGWQNISAYSHFELTDDVALRVSMEWQQNDGYWGEFNHRPQPAFFPQTPAADALVHKYHHKKSLLTQLEWQGLNLFWQRFDTRNVGLAGPATTVNIGELNYHSDLLGANYEWQNDWGQFRLYSDYNRFYLDIPTQALFAGQHFGIQQFANYGEDNFRIRGGINWQYSVSQDWQLDVGLESEQRKTGDYLQTDPVQQTQINVMPRQQLSESSLFLQSDYRHNDWRWVMGARLVDNQLYGKKLLPRLSVIHQMTPEQSLKLLFSSGFNSPNFVQLYIDIPPNVVSGNEQLTAERVNSVELAYSLQRQADLLTINMYRLDAKDTIQRLSNESGGATYNNIDSFSRSGIEIDWQRHVNAWKFILTANYTSSATAVKEDDISAAFGAKYSLSVGGEYRLTEQQQLGFSLRQIGKRGSAKALSLLNATYQLQLEHHQLQLSAENLLAEVIAYADVQDFDFERTIPGGDGSRNLFLRYNYLF